MTYDHRCQDEAMKDADPLSPDNATSPESCSLTTAFFDREQVTDLRHVVARLAGAAGLTGRRLEDFVLAANELITNAVRHGGGRGRLRLWRADAALHCEVSDSGLGITPDRLNDHSRPASDGIGGWGLWLARRLSDVMTVDSGPTGTTVRISTSVPAPPAAPAPESGPNPHENGTTPETRTRPEPDTLAGAGPPGTP